jgi:hypothetical protein
MSLPPKRRLNTWVRVALEMYYDDLYDFAEQRQNQLSVSETVNAEPRAKLNELDITVLDKENELQQHIEDCHDSKVK